MLDSNKKGKTMARIVNETTGQEAPSSLWGVFRRLFPVQFQRPVEMCWVGYNGDHYRIEMVNDPDHKVGR